MSTRGNLFRLLICVAFTISIAGAIQSRPIATQRDEPEIRVLLIGNSFTYFHNMPAILEAISNSSAGPRIKTTMVATGGAQLEDSWEAGSALSEIRKGGWNYVVLNEQSSLGDLLIVNQHREIADPAHFWKYANLFDREIRKVGAKTVVMMTWKDKAASDRSQQALDFAFVQFAKSNGAVVAPVSLAWKRIRETAAGVNLYFADDHHPSAEGSYLLACVLFTTLTGHNPVGAINTIKGTPVDEDEGTILQGKIETLVAIPIETARTLQQTAWDTYQEVRASGGYPVAPEPAPVALPTLPNGHRPSVRELEGVWRGPLHFYPNDLPVEVELRITTAPSGLRAILHVYYKGERPDVEVKLADFHLTDTGILFTDPEGPNKDTIEFSGAFASTSLAGIAKTLIPKTDPRIAVWGTWELRKIN